MTRKLISLLLATSLAGCTNLEPKYVQPEAPVPTGWPVGDAYLRQSEAALPAVSYRDIFRDPRLQALIEQALVNNRDLRVAAANIASARAQYRVQRAERLPQVNAGGGANVSGGGGQGTDDRYSVDVGVSRFELDLFGRVRSLGNSALNQYFATEAAARATRLSLTAEIATAYFTLAADRTLLAIARYFFVNAMTTISAVVFLYSPETKVASIAILNLDEAGENGAAAACAILITAAAAAVTLLFTALGSWVERRTEAWRGTGDTT